MFHKELLNDWLSLHLLDCGWYLDYPKDYTPALEIALRERIELGSSLSHKHLQLFGLKHPKTKGKRKGKERIKEIEDTRDEYIKVPLHGNIPSFGGFVHVEQVIPFHASLRVVVPPPPHSPPSTYPKCISI